MNETKSTMDSIREEMKAKGYNVFFVSNDCEIAKKIPKEKFLSKFCEFCEKAIEVKKKKGHDYGDVFEKTYGDYGLLSPIMRFRDKMGRIETLMKIKSNQVSDESIKDTILDLGNYCFMTAALMECIEDYKEEIRTKYSNTNISKYSNINVSTNE